MLPFEKARELVLKSIQPLPAETIPLAQAVGYFLAEPLIVTHDLPRFDCSAVDGYALIAGDVQTASPDSPMSVTVTDTVPAGSVPRNEVAVGQAQRILTGAPVPHGADAIVMREHTKEGVEIVRVARKVTRGENIRRRGEEFKAGAVALAPGTLLNAAAIGLAASLGLTELSVYRKPRVAIVTTGDEVIQPGTQLRPGQIYNSNYLALQAALRSLDMQASSISHVSDDASAVDRVLAEALEQSDVLITTGGVSVGDTDYVKDSLQRLGVELHFTAVAMKPGKPTCFGTRNHAGRLQFVFALPGNPVAVLMSFHHFVVPGIRGLMGDTNLQPLLISTVLETAVAKKRGRLEFLRGVVHTRDGRLYVTPTTGQDSHMLGGLATANCLIHFPADAENLAVGATVAIELLS